MAINSKSQTTVEGLDDLVDSFLKLPEEAVTFLEEASISPAQKILDKAKANVAKYNKFSDSGTLQKSLKLGKPNKKRKNKYEVFSKVSFPASAAHGVPLELGHKLVINGKIVGDVEEHAFLRPAAEENVDNVINAVADGINKALETFGGEK
jgi:predicted KAP-like P-loop ATPase